MSALPSKSNDRSRRSHSAERANAERANVDERLGLPVVSDKGHAEFGLWLDGELDALVARWVHLAAPRAGRSSAWARRGFQHL
jgi:hypothetical protein